MVQDSWRARRGRGTTVDTAIVSLGRIVDGLAMETPTQVAHSLLARGLPHIEAVAAQPQPGHAFNPPGRGQAPAGAAATCVGDSSSRLRLECCGAGSSVQMLFLYSYLRPHPLNLQLQSVENSKDGRSSNIIGLSHWLQHSSALRCYG